MTVRRAFWPGDLNHSERLTARSLYHCVQVELLRSFQQFTAAHSRTAALVSVVLFSICFVFLFLFFPTERVLERAELLNAAGLMKPFLDSVASAHPRARATSRPWVIKNFRSINCSRESDHVKLVSEARNYSNPI